MTTKVKPMGAVVAGTCDIKIHGVCTASGIVGALLVYNDSVGRQINVCKKCADRQFQNGTWIIDDGSNDLRLINLAHRKRFPNLVRGSRVKFLLADGSTLEGLVESISEDGITVNNQASTAGGYNESLTVAWIEILFPLP